MRIRIVRTPAERSIDGIQLDLFVQGRQYEIGGSLAVYLITQGWAEPVMFGEPALVVPFIEIDPFGRRARRNDPPNLIREKFPREPQEVPSIAADVRRRKKSP